MLTFIKTNYQVGDTIEITCSEGIVTGQIEYVTGQYIVLLQSNGQICGIAANDIRSFRAESPVKMVPANGGRAVKAPVYDSLHDSGVLADDSAEYNENYEEDDYNEEEQSSTATTLRDVLGEDKEVESADSLTGAAPVVEPKVVGHIDLASIDPNYGRRRYFKNEGGTTTAADNTDNNYSNNENDNEGRQQNYNTFEHRPPYVRATGRITYFNTLKRYGFIHDYASDSDLYFYVQQIVDPELFNRLYKGTKVVYTIGQNNQGRIATCIHLPHTINDVYTLAEDSFDSHQYVVSKGLLEHILQVDPDNADAKQLLGDVESVLPTVGGEHQRGDIEPYNPCLLYVQAKKSLLNKDYALAEETYLKALEANEKPESCVKDLLTLYVSCFKQATNEEEKERVRQKAADFFATHQHLLSSNLTTKQFLALNYYLPIQDYDKFLASVDELLSIPQVNESLSRRVFYLWQKAIALNKIGRGEEALEICEEGLKLSPYNRQLHNLHDMMLHPERYHASYGESTAAQQAEADDKVEEEEKAQEEPPATAETTEEENTTETENAEEAAEAETVAEAEADVESEDNPTKEEY